MSTLSDLIRQDDNTETEQPQQMDIENPVDDTEDDEEIIMDTPYDEALYGKNGKDPLPATTVMICVDRLYQSYNNLVTDYLPNPSYAMPQKADIKEIAEFDVKMVRI